MAKKNIAKIITELKTYEGAGLYKPDYKGRTPASTKLGEIFDLSGLPKRAQGRAADSVIAQGLAPKGSLGGVIQIPGDSSLLQIPRTLHRQLSTARGRAVLAHETGHVVAGHGAVFRNLARESIPGVEYAQEKHAWSLAKRISGEALPKGIMGLSQRSYRGRALLGAAGVIGGVGIVSAGIAAGRKKAKNKDRMTTTGKVLLGVVGASGGHALGREIASVKKLHKTMSQTAQVFGLSRSKVIRAMAARFAVVAAPIGLAAGAAYIGSRDPSARVKESWGARRRKYGPRGSRK